MTTELANPERVQVSAALQEKVLLTGDLKDLSPQERMDYYVAVCKSLDLNPLTKPFDFMHLDGKLVMYARKDCTEQLRTKRRVSVTRLEREVTEGIYVVTAHAEEQLTQRTDESIGAVPIANLQGVAKANAMMKAETKAKRRVTLSICGLGMLDETEIESIPGAQRPTSPDLVTDRSLFRGPDQIVSAPLIPAEPPDELESLIVDYEAALDSGSTPEEWQRTWDEIQRDSRLNSAAKARLFKPYSAKVKAFKKKGT